MQIINSTNLPQIAFCNMVYRQNSDGTVCVCWDRTIRRGKVLCRLLGRMLHNFITDGDGSHPTCRHLRTHGQQRPCELHRSNSFYKLAKLQ